MKHPAIALIAAALLASCGSPQNLVYVQDIVEGTPINVQEAQPIKLRPGDKLNISVHSRDEELSQMFNIDGEGSHGFYTVDEKGQIDFPILGLLTVRGLTRQEVAYTIKQRLLASQMIKDPTVTVSYVDNGFSVLGEVNNPGWHEFTQDQTTILEGIALSGDLTINGVRENVLVLRTVNGKQVPYRVDLTSMHSIYSSPVYYLQQGDMIYVEPNETRLNQSTPNGNSFRTPTFWISLFSFGLSVAILFTK